MYDYAGTDVTPVVANGVGSITFDWSDSNLTKDLVFNTITEVIYREGILSTDKTYLNGFGVAENTSVLNLNRVVTDGVLHDIPNYSPTTYTYSMSDFEWGVAEE